jgi:hypothetical protein
MRSRLENFRGALYMTLSRVLTIDVPEILLVAVVLPIQALMTFDPGAKMSTEDPKFDQDARLSRMVEAPTVITAGARAGETYPASLPSLPAATTTCTPAFTSCRFKIQG